MLFTGNGSPMTQRHLHPTVTLKAEVEYLQQLSPHNEAHYKRGTLVDIFLYDIGYIVQSVCFRSVDFVSKS